MPSVRVCTNCWTLTNSVPAITTNVTTLATMLFTKMKFDNKCEVLSYQRRKRPGKQMPGKQHRRPLTSGGSIFIPEGVRHQYMKNPYLNHITGLQRSQHWGRLKPHPIFNRHVQWLPWILCWLTVTPIWRCSSSSCLEWKDIKCQLKHATYSAITLGIRCTMRDDRRCKLCLTRRPVWVENRLSG